MWMSVVASFCSIAVSVTCSEEKESRLVVTSQGPVVGYKDNNEDIFIFNNIPYATAPTGGDKFKAPLPAPFWTKPLEAIDRRIICPQYETYFFPIELFNSQENCLVANVYVPNTAEKNLPVVVYIHPGGYIIGFGNMFTLKKMVANSKKMIAVTFNYRLAAHGFLCLGTKDVPGNAGMKDQVALLRWVKRNIASFGGNPNNVAIDGYSAGGSSVGLLMISKMSIGLFNKVMPESGDMLSPYSIQTNPVENSKEYARLIQCENVDDMLALENCYKNASFQTLLSGNVGNRSDFTFLFAPCVERDVGEERFLDESPVRILRSGKFKKLPILSGFTEMEGLMRIDLFDQWKVAMNANFSDFLPADLGFRNLAERNRVARKIKQFYFGDQPVDNATVLKYVDFLSDGYFTCPALRSTKLLVDAGNRDIYFYEYTYVDNNTPVVPHTNVRGAGHCYQLNALADEINGTEDNLSDQYKNWKSLMRETWTDFIINGKPENYKLPEWKPVRAGSVTHMRLNQHPVLKNTLLEDRCSFWNKIYDKYYQHPIPPTYT